jgi:hypothetical protein
MRRYNVERLPTNIMVEPIVGPPLSTPRPARANVAGSKPPDEMKQEMARRARM